MSYTYRAFGEQLKKLDNSGTDTEDDAKYSYGGKELDENTNLYYFNARYFEDHGWSNIARGRDAGRAIDATTGRFINVDPIQDGSNWYVYCDNNPLSMVDPSGLFHFAKTNLKGLPWMSLSRGPILNVLNVEVSHEHGFFDDGSKNNIGLFSKIGKVKWNTENHGDYKYFDRTYYDDDLIRKAIANVGSDQKYGLLWFGIIGDADKKNNCQDFSTNLRSEYKKMFKELSSDQQKNILQKKDFIEGLWKDFDTNGNASGLFKGHNYQIEKDGTMCVTDEKTIER